MLKEEIINYWAERSEGYSKVNKDELFSNQKEKWLKAIEKRISTKDKSRCKVLDIGTGPGFFSIIMAEAGYDVTAVDFTEEMLEEAKTNAKNLKEKIKYVAMNAEELSFEDDTFDVIITRNLTWNLVHPEKAYKGWIRVLKKGGVMLNFDANWYCYLDDEEKREMYIYDRNHAAEHEMEDYYEGTDIEWMEDIARRLPLSNTKRPEWDEKVLKEIGVNSLIIEEDVWQEVWAEDEKVNYATTPMFLVLAQK